MKEMPAEGCDRGAIGSPQPPPGGGLQLPGGRCRPSARLRAFARNQSRSDWRAAASARRRPAVRCRTCVPSAGCVPKLTLELRLQGCVPLKLMQAYPLGCGFVLGRNRSGQDRAGRSFAWRRPALASASPLAGLLQAAARNFGQAYFKFRPRKGRSGPQPPPGEGPLLLIVADVLRRL